MTRAYDKLSNIVTRLKTVKKAAGYLTNAGQSVLLGPIPRMDGEPMPFIRLLEVDAVSDGSPGYAPQAKFTVNFIAEAHAEQDAAGSIMSTGHDLIADLQKAMFGDPNRDLDGNLFQINPEGYRILPPETGSDVVIAQVRGNFVLPTKFSAP